MSNDSQNMQEDTQQTNKFVQGYECALSWNKI